jgi:MFS family permease
MHPSHQHASEFAERQPFYYGWVVLVVAAIAMTATLPGRTHGLGLITEPLLEDLHLDRVTYSALNFWAILIGAAFCWPVGRLLDRFGCRIVLTLVSALLGLVVLLLTLCETPAALFIVLTLIRGLGQGALSVVSLAIVGKWFVRRLPTAMGVYAVLLAIGFIAATLGLGAAVQEHGWKQAWGGLGVVLLVGMAPLAWLLARNSPETCGLPPDGTFGADSNSGDVDMSLLETLRTPAFWVFSSATALFGMLWSAITLFNEAILREHGFDARTYYLAMALLTAGGLVANMVVGWLAMRWPLGRLLGLGMFVLAAQLVAFPGVRTFPAVVLYSLGLGAAGGFITVVHLTFYGRAFGRRDLGQIQGAAQVLSIFASALGPWLLAVWQEKTGSYDTLFVPAGIFAVVLGVGAWAVPLPRRLPELKPSPA